MAYFNGKRILNARVEGLYETGYVDGEKVGYADGYTQGEQEGYAKGYQNGYTEGETDGKSAERNTFWDSYQQNGQRTNYTYAFYGYGWYDDIYNPQYPIKPIHGNGIYNLSYITDTKVPIDLTAVGNNSQVFTYATRLVTINKVIFAANVSVSSACFQSCGALKNLTVEGDIGCSIDLHWSTLLTHDSLMSIINHLATVSTTKTLTLGETNLAKLTDAEKAIATEKGWTLA